MTFVGSVDRLGLGSPSGHAAALFGFEDALVIVPLGLAVKPGFRPSKKNQARLDELTQSADLSPEKLHAQWADSVTLGLSEIRSAELRKSLQGGLFGTVGLRINTGDGRTQQLLAHRSVKQPLGSLLASLLGDRFKNGT